MSALAFPAALPPPPFFLDFGDKPIHGPFVRGSNPTTSFFPAQRTGRTFYSRGGRPNGSIPLSWALFPFFLLVMSIVTRPSSSEYTKIPPPPHGKASLFLFFFPASCWWARNWAFMRCLLLFSKAQGNPFSLPYGLRELGEDSDPLFDFFFFFFFSSPHCRSNETVSSLPLLAPPNFPPLQGWLPFLFFLMYEYDP